jgi:transposase
MARVKRTTMLSTNQADPQLQAKRSRWRIHFTPTGASWINQIERVFVLIAEKQIKRGIHRSV